MPIWVTVLLVAVALKLLARQSVVRARSRRTEASPGRPSLVAIVFLVVIVAALIVISVVHHQEETTA